MSSPHSALKPRGSVASKGRVSIVEMAPMPPPGPQNQEEVIDSMFDELLDYIIIESVYLTSSDRDMHATESAFDIDSLNSEVFDFIGPRDSLTMLRKSRPKQALRKSIIGSRSSIASFKKKPSVCLTKSEILEYELPESQIVRIYFKNGGVYEGELENRLPSGNGKYFWPDGTVYEGEFRDGFPNGYGEMVLPNLDDYKGEFFYGIFHGEGFLNVKETPMFYNGSWQYGKKHGFGRIVYDANCWYNGYWSEDLRHGEGLHYYQTTGRYKGAWQRGQRHGYGAMTWENSDFGRGEWRDGLLDGKGDYVWKSYFNKTLTFPIRNSYEGEWSKGKRHGYGVMRFGTESGAKYSGHWYQDFKHGDGEIVCGNGKVIKYWPLFEQDKPWFIFNDISIFTVAEGVDVGYYIDQVIAPGIIEEDDEIKIQKMREFERLCIQNAIVEFLPQLTDIYSRYATITTKEIPFEAVLVRLFLWLFYRDIKVYEFGVSLVKIDEILKEHPGCCLQDAHDPFEKIHFWQFLMSIVGVALHCRDFFADQLDFSVHEGACSLIFKVFLNKLVFGGASTVPGTLTIRYIDLVPITAAYKFYQRLGEPLTALAFLKATCTRPLCDDCANEEYPLFRGINACPLEYVVHFFRTSSVDETIKNPKFRKLSDFACLGPKNVLKCICKVCPLVQPDGVIANMEYPMVFFEFYEILLECIFLYIELKLRREKHELQNEIVLREKELLEKQASFISMTKHRRPSRLSARSSLKMARKSTSFSKQSQKGN